MTPKSDNLTTLGVRMKTVKLAKSSKSLDNSIVRLDTKLDLALIVGWGIYLGMALQRFISRQGNKYDLATAGIALLALYFDVSHLIQTLGGERPKLLVNYSRKEPVVSGPKKALKRKT